MNTPEKNLNAYCGACLPNLRAIYEAETSPLIRAIVDASGDKFTGVLLDDRFSNAHVHDLFLSRRVALAVTSEGVMAHLHVDDVQVGNYRLNNQVIPLKPDVEVDSRAA